MNDISNALMRNDVRVAVLVGLMVGGTSGYFITRAVITKQIQQVANDEIQSVKDHYERKAKLNKEGVYSDPANLVDNPAEEVVESVTVSKADGEHVAYDKIISDNDYAESEVMAKDTLVQEPDKTAVREEVVVNNVFHATQPSIGQRRDDTPYLITMEEFVNNDEFSFDQITLTYYEGDDSLVDEREDLVSDVLRTVGRDNLLRFGEGSQDENVVYVRNERLRSDFEIVRDPGKYSVSVLGMHDDVERNG